MDDDGDTDFVNSYEKLRFRDVLVRSKNGKNAFVFFCVCVAFALLTMISTLIPNLSYTLEFSLKAILTLGAMISAYKVYLKCVKSVFTAKFNIEVSVAVSTLILYAFAIMTGFHMFENKTEFDNDFCFIVIVIVLTGVLFGDFVKCGLKNRSNDAICRISELLPKDVNIIKDGQAVTVEFKDIIKDDIAKVMPGDKIPFDAVVIEGETTVDESALTGESVPVKKIESSKVYAGGINKYGEILIKSVGNAENSLVCKLVSMAKKELEKEFERPDFTQKINKIYFPMSVLISVVLSVSKLISGATAVESIAFGIIYFALLCPSAIAFAEPILSLAVILRAYKNNISIQNPNVIGILNDIDVFAFDKSGTLTKGEYEVTSVNIIGQNKEDDILKYILGIEATTEHFLSDAIFEYAYSKGVSPFRVDEVLFSEKSGVRAIVAGKEICFGDATFFEKGIFDNYLKNDDRMYACMTVDSLPAAVIAAEDRYKEGSELLLESLKKQGIKVNMLTKDALADTQDDEFEDFFPDVKAKKIKSIKKAGNTVAMIGDGINDTVALITADVGICVGSATDAALEASDVIMPAENISDVLKLLDLSNLYCKIAKQNLIFSIIFNSVLFVLTIFGSFELLQLSQPVIFTALISVLTVFANTERIHFLCKKIF